MHAERARFPERVMPVALVLQGQLYQIWGIQQGVCMLS